MQAARTRWIIVVLGVAACTDGRGRGRELASGGIVSVGEAPSADEDPDAASDDGEEVDTGDSAPGTPGGPHDPSDGRTEGDGGGDESQVDLFDVGTGAASGVDEPPPVDCGMQTDLVATVRDFRTAHADFEYVQYQIDHGIVEDDLGADGKPVYAGNPWTPSTTGAANFDQWYRDTDGVNWTTEIVIPLVDEGDGTFVFEDDDYFPLDGDGFGNEGNNHNFHFTTEIHTEFVYEGGETFVFKGDDDVFVFINGRLAIDLGGVHGDDEADVDLDDDADHLGITPGNVYDLDIFHAERHTTESHFRIQTTIGCLVTVPPG